MDKSVAEIQGRSRLERFIFFFLYKYFFRSDVRNSAHYHEWWQLPMNYVRQMELPLTMELLDVKSGDRILDVSSPKLLAFYYSYLDGVEVVASDRDDYFVGDFDLYSELWQSRLRTSVFDVTKQAPFPDNSFDKIFSVSVLEHIASGGDSTAVQEMIRLLQPNGNLVISVPAWNRYVEEWLTEKHFYWDTVQNEEGKYFYQKRYDVPSIRQRFGVDGVIIEKIVLVAEKPVHEAYVGENGMFLHNLSYFRKTALGRFAQFFSRIKLPLCAYFAHRNFSNRCHYITEDESDPNIRVAIVQLTKV